MSKKEVKEAVLTEEEKAIEVLKAAEKAKIDAFVKEYKELCVKHGLEIVAQPQLSVAAIQRPQ